MDKPVHISKHHFDKAYNEKMDNLKKLTPENDYLASDYFNQSAFNKTEIKWHFRSTMFISFAIFFVVGFKMQLLVFLIKHMPFPLVGLLGHAPKCIFMTICMMNTSILGAIYVKSMFYRIVAWHFGYENLQLSDDMFLFDIPANPINIPGYMMFKK